MKKQLKDWRNVSLGLAIFVILILVWLLWVEKSGSRALVTINQVPITERMLTNEIKHRYGDQMLINMISDRLVASYAAVKKVDASKDDIDQLLRFQRFNLRMNGMDLDQSLKEQGKTLADFMEELRIEVLNIKLIVPEADRRETFERFASRLNYPPIYKLRDYYFASKEDAGAGAAILRTADKSGNNIVDASAKALNGMKATEVIDYIPSGKPEAQMVDAQLTKMKAGEVSEPFRASPQDPTFHVIQLVSMEQGEKATLENRNIVVGFILMNSPDTREKYSKLAAEVKAEALQKVDVAFQSGDYARAHEMFQKATLENPKLPTANPDSLPTVPGLGTTPAAPPTAPSTAPAPKAGGKK